MGLGPKFFKRLHTNGERKRAIVMSCYTSYQ